MVKWEIEDVFRVVEEGSLEELDEVIHNFYSQKCWIRNLGGDDYYDFTHSGLNYEMICNQVEKYIKPLAKKYGLYPYNQEVVYNP